MKQRFSFCPKCGGSLRYLPRGERQRLTCELCEYVLYENPIVGVAGIVIQDEHILLGRRSVNSTYPGLWCIPCGYVEYDEDVETAVKREFLEETGLEIEPVRVFTALSNFHNPNTHTVGIWYLVRVLGGELSPGDDVDQVGYFSFDAIPPLAFPTDQTVIARLRSREFRNDCKKGVIL